MAWSTAASTSQSTPTTSALETKITRLEQGLGDTRSLVIPVAPTIYWEAGAQARAEMGIAEGLIRVSVGLEEAQDLIGDFAQALGYSSPS